MEIKEALEKLESFKALGKDWDSYGGYPPTPAAIEAAKRLLEGLFVCPVCDGTISITLGDDEEVTILVGREGEVWGLLK